MAESAATARQLAHTGHRHQDAQSAVVFAAVAHRVVVRAGQQPWGLGLVAMVDAHHIAHCIGANLVKTTGVHAQAQGAGAGLVGGGQIRHGQLAALGKARVTELGQPFMPVPHLLPQGGLNAQFVVEADFGNAMDVAQSFGEFKVHRVVQSPHPGGDDLFAGQTHCARPAHGQDERKPKLGLVVPVELLNLGQLMGVAVGQARTALLIGGCGRQIHGQHGLARQLRVGANEGQLVLARRFTQHLNHGLFELSCAGKWALRQGTLSDPVRVFVQALHGLDGLRQGQLVDFGQADAHGRS